MGRKPTKAKQFARIGGPIRERELTYREEQELEDSALFEYTPFQNENPLHIPAEVLRSIRDGYGYSLVWAATEVLGMPQDASVAIRKKNRFEFVTKGNFGGILDSYCDSTGLVKKGGLQLMARPYEIEEIARSYERKQAKKAIADMRKKHAEEGVPNVSMPGGGKHKSALAQNRHRTEMERIDVPEE